MLQERIGFYREPVALDNDEVISRTEWLKYELESLPVGAVCVYLDGKVLSVDASDIMFNDWFARHAMDAVPHRIAGESKTALKDLMGNKSYWLERQLKDADTS